MKKTIQSIFIIAIAVSVIFSSCSKDEATTAAPTTPTVILTDSFGTNVVDTTNFYLQPYVQFKVTPLAGTTLKLDKFEVKRNGILVTTSNFSAIDPVDANGFSQTISILDIISGLPMAVGNTITFIYTVKDSKDNIGSSSITYTVINDKAIIASNEIVLGAQTNATLPNKFFGLANTFGTYTAGLANGTAKNNSSNIDFVYYFGLNDKNALAAPANVDGAKSIWGGEITTWSRQNRTKFKTTAITTADFDNIKNNSKTDDLFASIDFTSGTTEKTTNLAVGSVFAFQTVPGVKGLAKVTAVSADANGSLKVIVICQN